MRYSATGPHIVTATVMRSLDLLLAYNLTRPSRVETDQAARSQTALPRGILTKSHSTAATEAE